MPAAKTRFKIFKQFVDYVSTSAKRTMVDIILINHKQG